MVIEDMQQSLELLENIKNFFYNIEEIEKKLNMDLRNKEYERDDLLHEIELSKLNAIEIVAVYKKLEKVLQERRIIKDKIDLVSTIKPYANKFIAKGICAERYALGRRTYIVQWTCEFIGNNLHLLTEKDKQVMIRDIENPISYGDECDKVCWMQLLEKLRKEKNK